MQSQVMTRILLETGALTYTKTKNKTMLPSGIALTRLHRDHTLKNAHFSSKNRKVAPDSVLLIDACGIFLAIFHQFLALSAALVV